jgi:signal transduction histidine kinase
MSPSVSLMPHAVCWAAAPRLVWTMVITNFITFLAYVSICGTLFFLVRRTRSVIARDWAYFGVGFALFIVACGSTHLLEVITTWIPIFWVDAGTNIVTAVLSAYVAFMLIKRASVIGFSINDYADRLANTENEKAQMQQSLLAARKLEDLSRMSATISHEIGNPLEAVQNLLYLIRTVKMAHTAADEATRVLTISRSTLSFFREGPRPERIDLATAAESVRFLLDTLARERHVKIDIVTSGDLTIQSYPGEVRQIMLNLVRNACEATEQPGGRVTLTLKGQPSGVEVTVSDPGIGIGPAQLPTLFEFGRTTKGDQGNGMGLWTVKQLLTRHGGVITVDSSPGRGTHFTLWWPRNNSAAVA